MAMYQPYWLLWVGNVRTVHRGGLHKVLSKGDYPVAFWDNLPTKDAPEEFRHIHTVIHQAAICHPWRTQHPELLKVEGEGGFMGGMH